MAGGVHDRRCPWQEVCMARGIHGKGHVWWGVCMAGGVCGREHAWQGVLLRLTDNPSGVAALHSKYALPTIFTVPTNASVYLSIFR